MNPSVPTPSESRRWRRGVALVVGVVGGFAVALGAVSAWWTEAGQPVADRLPAMLIYWVAYAGVWLSLTWVGWRLWRGGEAAAGAGAGYGKAALVIVVVALIARVGVVWATQPRLSDDIWRYIHDGAVFARGDNPYAAAPADLAAAQVPSQAVRGRMNYPELVTVYQPVSQFVFGGLSKVWSVMPRAYQQWDATRDRTFRLGFVLFDVLIVGGLLLWLREAGRSAWWASLYGWHPLAISETAVAGHQDVIGIALLVGALYLTYRFAARAGGHTRGGSPNGLQPGWACSGALFAAAVAVKPFVVPLALAWMWWRRRRMSDIALWLLGGAVVGLAVYLPFVFMEGGIGGMVETLRLYLAKWAFNGSLHPLFMQWIGDRQRVDMLAHLITLLILAAALVRGESVAVVAAIFVTTFLLLSSTVHAWYLLWALALLPVVAAERSTLAMVLWLWSGTIALSYAAHLHAGYRLPGWFLWLEYTPVYAAVAAVYVRHIRRSTARRRGRPPVNSP